MSYLDNARDMYNMLAEGKLLDAFEKYYHADVVMEEATGENVLAKKPTGIFRQNF